MSGPENDLTSTLQQRADDFARLGGHDLDLAQVVSRAGEIRRGRRMRASMMMAAVVVAVAVPIGVVALQNGSTGNNPTNPSASTSPPTPSPSVSDTSEIGITGVPVGHTTEIGVSAGGTLFDLPNSSLSLRTTEPIRAIAKVGKGFLVAYESTASYFTADGGSDQSWPYAGSGFAVSSGGNVGAFVESDGTVRAVQDSGSLNFAVGTAKLPADSYSVDAVVGENCSGRSDLDAGCTVYVSSRGQHPAVWSVSPHQAPKQLTTGAFEGVERLAGISVDNQVAGMVSASDSGSCWDVRPFGSDGGWETCEYSLISFSPDGRYLLAGQDYQSGAGDTQLAVFDAKSGQVLLDLKTAKNAFIGERAWEDPTHVVATVYDQGTWAIERIDVRTGERELAGPTPNGGEEQILGDDGSMVSPFKLSASR